MESRSSLCTFTPLGQGRLRCNQTGDVIKRAMAKSYQRSFLGRNLEAHNAKHNPLRQREEAPESNRRSSSPTHIPILEARQSENGDIWCPYCHKVNYYTKLDRKTATVCRESSCKRTFMAVPPGYRRFLGW